MRASIHHTRRPRPCIPSEVRGLEFLPRPYETIHGILRREKEVTTRIVHTLLSFDFSPTYSGEKSGYGRDNCSSLRPLSSSLTPFSESKTITCFGNGEGVELIHKLLANFIWSPQKGPMRTGLIKGVNQLLGIIHWNTANEFTTNLTQTYLYNVVTIHISGNKTLCSRFMVDSITIKLVNQQVLNEK